MTRWLYLAIALTVAAFAASAYVYFFQYDRLPERIPIHWDINGRPDGWVSRDQAWMNFWLIPALMAGFVVLTVVLPWISPKSFKVEPFRDTYGYVMALVVVLFGYIHGILLWSSLNPGFPTGRSLVAGILGFLALLGNVLGRVRRNFWIGIRTPWTLASDTVWVKTHRLGAWLFVAFGLIGVIAALAGAPLVFCFGGLIAVALFLVLYSLAIYKRLEKQGRL